ncbi:MAG: tRNA (adenosine(37)-N6)-dimethylallyltransferase MiaA [Alloprevotella sp.]
MEQKSYDLITVLGPTASGKTRFAVQLADRLGAEIISGDSRQVYRRMDLGTGKDLDDYRLGDHSVPYHLIDIAEPGTKYNVFEYQRDFLEAYNDIRRRDRKAVLCGGTGLYIESVLRAYRLSPVPQNPELRERLSGKSLEELTALLATYKSLHNTTDVDTAQRAIRAIEIEEYYRQTPLESRPFPKIESLTLGVDVSREVRRERISQRLRKRLDEGMCGEVERLLAEGIKPEDLIYYGLEYKYVTLYVTGQITFDEMAAQLEIAIHQFAKRQMTWFRGMERRGVPILWIRLGEDFDETLRLNPGLEERIYC